MLRNHVLQELVPDGVGLHPRHHELQLLPGAPGEGGQLQGGAVAVGVVQPVALPPGIVVGTHVHEQGGVRPVQGLRLGAHGPVDHGTLNVPQSVNVTLVQHVPLQDPQGPEQGFPVGGGQEGVDAGLFRAPVPPGEKGEHRAFTVFHGHASWGKK